MLARGIMTLVVEKMKAASGIMMLVVEKMKAVVEKMKAVIDTMASDMFPETGDGGMMIRHTTGDINEGSKV